MRYYVDNSSWFDTHPYNRAKIAKAVEKGGGTNIREARKNGWSNQPKVVTFSIPAAYAHRVYTAVSTALRTSWITIRPKDW